MVVNKIFRDVKQNNVGKVTDGERDTQRQRNEGRSRTPAGTRSTGPGPVRRGQCGAQADGAIRPRQLLTPRQAQGPAWGAGGVRAPPAPRGPRSTAPWSPRALPHPSPPHLCWGPRCPRVLRPAARGAPSTPARSQPFQPPAVRRSGPLAQLPGGRGEPVSCARGVCFRARSAPSPTAARASRPRWRRRPAGPLWTPAPGASFALPLSLFEVVLVIPRLRTSTRFRISVLSSTFQKPRERSQGSGVTHRSVSGDAASWRWGPPAAGAAGSPFFGSSPVRAGRFGFSGRKSSTVLARHRVC